MKKPFVPVCVCAALALCGTVAAAAPAKASHAKPPATILMLADQNVSAATVGDSYGAEVFRQAVLIAAHTEMGLEIRDAGLGEAVNPKGVPGAQELQLIETTNFKTHSIDLTLRRVQPAAPAPLWSGQVPFANIPAWRLSPYLAARAAAFVPALRKALIHAGFANHPPIGTGAVITPLILQHLHTMNFIAQWRAVRSIDRTLRHKGFTAQGLSLLARGYANLGLLTDQLFTGYRDAYKARAMVYADLLTKKYPHAAVVPWTKAYVDALAGLPVRARAELTKARATAGAKAPRWAKVIGLYLNFNTMALIKMMRSGGGESRLSEILAVLTLQYCDTASRLERTILRRSLQKGSIDTFYLIESLEMYPSIGEGRRLSNVSNAMLGNSLALRLKHMQNLPASIRQQLANSIAATVRYAPKSLHDIIDSVADAGAPALDRGCPSFQALSAMARSIAVFNCERRLEFLRFEWDVGFPYIQAYLHETRPLLGHSQWWPLLECFGVPNATPGDRAKLATLMKSLHVFNPTINVMTFSSIVAGIKTLPPARGNSHSPKMIDIDHGLLAQASNDQGKLSDEMDQQLQYAPSFHYAQVIAALKLNPLDPVCVSESLSYFPALCKQYMKQWKQASHHSIAVLSALTYGYKVSPRFKNIAQHYLENFSKIDPERWALAGLAADYRNEHQDAKYVATMQKVIQDSGDAVTAANMSARLANYLMNRGRYRQARPFVVNSAQTWAEAPMWAAARCYSGLGKYNRAQKWMRRVTQRYPDNAACAWYFWCMAEKKGDLNAARAFAAQNLGQLDAADTYSAAVFEEMAGHPRHAISDYLAAARTDPSSDIFCWLHAALLADSLKMVALRNRLLSLAAKNTARKSYAKLAQLFIQALKPGKTLNLKAVRKLENRSGRIWWPEIFYYTGRFLQLHGNRAAAIRYFRNAAQHTAYGGPGWYLHVVALHNMGVKFNPDQAMPRGTPTAPHK